MYTYIATAENLTVGIRISAYLGLNFYDFLLFANLIMHTRSIIWKRLQMPFNVKHA